MFVYFSDDACYSRREANGTVTMYNVDIKKCDASHTGAIFYSIKDVLPAHVQDDFQILIDQCTSDIVMTAPEDIKNKMKVRLRPREPTLYSGSTATTVINNHANGMIGYEFSRAPSADEDALTAAAAKVGYSISLERCQLPEDLQFLKHSPVKNTHGHYWPVLNIGVLLRASGVCRGDLPGREPIAERAATFQCALLRGMYPTTHFTLIDSMKAVVAGSKVSEVMDKFVTKTVKHRAVDDVVINHFDDHQLYLRYRERVDDEGAAIGCDSSDIVALNHLLGGAGFEAVHSSPASRAILKMDYGI
jgi:hypothetical protein